MGIENQVRICLKKRNPPQKTSVLIAGSSDAYRPQVSDLLLFFVTYFRLLTYETCGPVTDVSRLPNFQRRVVIKSDITHCLRLIRERKCKISCCRVLMLFHMGTLLRISKRWTRYKNVLSNIVKEVVYTVR